MRREEFIWYKVVWSTWVFKYAIVLPLHSAIMPNIPLLLILIPPFLLVLQEREVYLPVAQCGSVAFFLISDLCKLNSMYQFGLPSFLRLFRQALTFEEVSCIGINNLRLISVNICSAVLFHTLSTSLNSKYLCILLSAWYILMLGAR